jgi:signal transduction histidine kinase
MSRRQNLIDLPENLLEQKGRQLHEKLMLPILLFGVGYTILNIVLGIYLHAAFSSIVVFSVILSWIINRKGYHYAAQIWTFFHINTTVFFIAMISHLEVDVYLFYFPIAIGAYLIFQGKHKSTRTIVALVSLAGLILTATMDFEGVIVEHLEEVNIEFERLANVFGTFIFLVIEIVYLINLNEKIQEKLVEKQQTLDVSFEKLKSSLYTRDQIMSILAHDVRSPLTNINGLLEVIEFAEIDSKDKKELLHKLQEKTSGTLQMVEDVLRWSRMQQDSIVFKPEKMKGIDLYNLIGSVCKVHEDLLLENELIYNDCSSINDEVMIDRNMMESIFRNLFSNAIKFTRDNRKIEVRVSGISDYILFQVIDNGLGMSQSDADKLMSGISFTTSNSGSVKGIGLGNQIVVDFLKYHNSKIEVASAIGKGTTISFRIKTL